MDKWDEYAKCTTKPIAELVELNVKTLNHLVSNSKNFTELLQSKNPADLFSAEAKILNDASNEAMRYAQETSNIWLDVINQANKALSNSFEESTTTVSDMIKPVAFGEALIKRKINKSAINKAIKTISKKAKKSAKKTKRKIAKKIPKKSKRKSLKKGKRKVKVGKKGRR